MRRLFFSIGIEVVGVILLSICSYVYFREFVFLLMVVYAMIYIVSEIVLKNALINAKMEVEISKFENPQEDDLQEAFDDLMECMQEVEDRING